jgi:hypothetical protein
MTTASTPFVLSRLKVATEHGKVREERKAAVIDRETPKGATITELLDLAQQDGADLRVALGRAEAQVEHLCLALIALGVPKDIVNRV